GGLATPEPNIVDAVPQQTVQDHGIRPVDEGADPFFPPDEPALVAFMGRLEHETDPLRSGLALQTLQPASIAAEVNPPGCADADAIGGVIGTTRQRLGRLGVEVVCDPGGIRLGRKGMQGVFRKAMLASAAPRKRLCGPVCRNAG